MRLRPAELSAVLKRLLAIRRIWLRSLDGIQFWADPVSDFGFRLLTEGIYEPQMTRLVRTVLGPRHCFVDVGANEGWFTVIAARQATEGRVLAVEPQSKLQEVIHSNLRMNGVSSAEVFRLALSDQCGERALHLTPSTNPGAGGFYARSLVRRSEKVETATLDELLRRNKAGRVRLLKIDCEGAEDLVVRGAARTLGERLVDYLALEYHPGVSGGDSCLRTHEKVVSFGYRLTKLDGQHIYHLPGLHPPLLGLGPALVDCVWDA